MTISETIREIGAKNEAEIVELRRHFHRNPELGGQEFDTSNYICGTLAALGVEYRRVKGPRPAETREGRDDFLGTGIIATIRGEADGAYDSNGEPARRVALRTDMDALPVTELTDLVFKSRNEGRMHACGHDCHMAMMLGAVRMLNELRGQLKGEVRVLFQPAEEVSLGARDMIAAGALDGVEAIYGQHIWSEVDAGKISAQAGPRMASTDWFRIDIKGTSAHGSMPHKGVDAIVIAAKIVDSLQVLVSRDVSPFKPVVVTVGEIHGGEARNIMAGSAYLTGTVRAWDQSTRDMIPKRMQHIIEEGADAFSARATLEYESGNPNLVNDPKLAETAAKAVTEVLGQDALADYEGTLAGEDFSEYLRHVPGVFVFIGTRNPEKDCVYPQHSEHYKIDEDVLVNGAMVATQWACDMLA